MQGRLISFIVCCIFIFGAAFPAQAAIVYGSGATNPGLEGGIYLIDTDAGTSTLAFDPGVGFAWYGATDGDEPNVFFATPYGDSLYRIDVVAETATVVGSYGGPVIKELAYNEVTDVLYGTDYNDLFTINKSTGVATAIGSHNGPNAVWAMDYHPGIDEIVAVNETDHNTYYIDMATGNAEYVGATGANRITDVWYDAGSGEMFAVGNAPNRLLSIDPVNGDATLISEIDHNILGLGAGSAQLMVYMDIKPRSCPNPLNVKVFEKPPNNAMSKKGGVLPVAILGTAGFDVTDVDVGTLLLEGVAPIRHGYEDVATPLVGGEPCECNTEGPDGALDLTLKFEKAEIAAALGSVSDREVIQLTLTGELNDGTPFETSDCVWILSKDEGPVIVESTGDVVLGPAIPNPFNPVTQIKYHLPNEGFVRISVFDVRGMLIENLVARVEGAGDHIIKWDAGNLPSGTYFCRLMMGDFTQTRKMILLK